MELDKDLDKLWENFNYELDSLISKKIEKENVTATQIINLKKPLFIMFEYTINELKKIKEENVELRSKLDKKDEVIDELEIEHSLGLIGK